MYLFVGLMIVLSLAAAFPLAFNYWRRQQSISSRRRVPAPDKSRRTSSVRTRAARSGKSVGKSLKKGDRRGTRTSARRANAAGTARRRHYKASSIVPGENCCPAVVKAAGKRFLTDEAPILPLERCDRIGECACTFTHHADRRCGDDRRNPVGALSSHGQIGSKQVNRRGGMDRRSGLEDELESLTFL